MFSSTQSLSCCFSPCFVIPKNLGERLRDHLKKAVETEKETEEQLNLLLEKLNETGRDLISLLSLFFPSTNYIVPLRVKKN